MLLKITGEGYDFNVIIDLICRYLKPPLMMQTKSREAHILK